MRYNLETMLPLGAFEHCGNRHIKLYGGGGSWNPIEIVSNAFESVGDVLADIDPGPAIGSGLAEVDDFVNDVIPGGWVLPAAVAVAVTTGYVDPTIFGEVALSDVAAVDLIGESYAVPGVLESLSGVPIELLPEMIPDVIPMELLPEMIPDVVPVELLPEMIPDFPIDPGITLEQATFGDVVYPGDAQYEAQDIMEQARSTNVPSGSPTSWDTGTGLSLSDALSTARTIKQGYDIVKSINNAINPPVRTPIPPRTPLTPTTTTTTNPRVTSTNPLTRYLTQSGFSDATMPSGSSSSSGGALPGSLRETSLAAAPVTQGSTMNLNQLKQLYPQLSNVDPRILQMLTGKQSSTPNYFTYGGDQGGGGGTSLTNTAQGGSPSAGIPSVASDRASQTKFAGASPIGGYSALNSAGLQAINTGALPGMTTYGLKDGGNVHVPQFKTGTTGHFVQGQGDGQSDDIPAMLADGEYVFDADTVAALGNGSSKAGALQLDKMRQAIRKHKRSAPNDKIPPKAKSPLEYLKG